MIKLLDILNERTYPFSEYDATYHEEDNSLIDVEYIFNTGKSNYKVVFSSKDKAGVFDLSFGIDTGTFNKLDTFQMTGEGNAKNILQTLAEIINDFCYQYGEVVDKVLVRGTSEKRSRVYKALLPKYLSSEAKKKTEIS